MGIGFFSVTYTNIIFHLLIKTAVNVWRTQHEKETIFNFPGSDPQSLKTEI